MNCAFSSRLYARNSWYCFHLQAKKGGEVGTKEAESAENLLLANKQFTDLMSLVTQLVSILISALFSRASSLSWWVSSFLLYFDQFSGEYADSHSTLHQSLRSHVPKISKASILQKILSPFEVLIYALINTLFCAVVNPRRQWYCWRGAEVPVSPGAAVRRRKRRRHDARKHGTPSSYLKL